MLRLRLLIALLCPAALAVLSPASALYPLMLPEPSVLGLLATALSVVLVAGVAYLVLRLVVAVDPAPATAHGVGLRARAELSAFLRLRDPDAAGRPRPRAPGGLPAIAG